MNTGYSPTLCLVMLVLALIPVGCAYQNNFEKTSSGAFEVKTLPAAKVIATQEEGVYFDRDNQMFMKLFNYIRRNDVSMTVPVTADLNPAGMQFFVGPKDWGKLKDDADVKVVDVPERTVASHGVRGSYSKDNVDGALARLNEWLGQHPQYKKVGEPYAVFWNGPYVPGFMKRFEVHIPVSVER